MKSVLLAAALLLAAPAVSEAATWRQVTAPGGASIDEVAAARTANGVLHVVWHKDGNLIHTSVLPDGKVGASSPIQSGWTGHQDAGIAVVPGGLRVVWGALRSTDSNDPQRDMNSAFSSNGGVSWALTPGSVVAPGGQAYGSDAAATTLPNGTVLQAWTGTLGTWVHAGLDPATPNFDYQGALGTYGYGSGIVADSAGKAMMAWFSSAAAHTGVLAQAVNPDGSPGGAPLTMPGTQVMVGGWSGSRTSIVARPKAGGFYVGYPVGYPSANRVLVWRVGAAKAVELAKTEANSDVAVAADPKGRVWAVWSEGTFGAVRIMAARSNPAATRWGAAVDLGAVKNASQVYSVDANATGTALDVLTLFGLGTEAGGSTYVARAQPGLSLSVKRGVFSVQDAGEPVKGATVKLGGRSARTNAAGKAKLAGRGTATATAAGYEPATLKVK